MALLKVTILVTMNRLKIRVERSRVKMLNTIMTNWAKQFFYTGLGIPAPGVLPEDVEKLVPEYYKICFENPVATLFYGEHRTLTDDDVTRALRLLKESDVSGRMYLLRTLADSGKASNVGDELPTVLKNYVSKAEKYVAVATTSESVFEVYMSGTKQLGWHPVDICILGPSRRFKNTNNLLQSLASSSPTSLNDFCIEAIRRAVDFGVLSKEVLNSTTYPIVKNGVCIMQTVTALTPELPSYRVRKLLSYLPNTTKKEYPSWYHAALAFALESSDEQHKHLIPELDAICKQIGDTPSLNDDVVRQYLAENYGINVDKLSSITQTAKSQLFASDMLLDKDIEDMTVKDYLQSITDDNDFPTSTLDGLIESFCESEGFDKNCSVQQLLDFIITGKEQNLMKVKTFKEMATDAYNAKELNPNTTLEEFVHGTEHVDVSEEKICFDYISKSEVIPEKVKLLLISSMRTGTQYIPEPERPEITAWDVATFMSNHNDLDDASVCEITNALLRDARMCSISLDAMLRNINIPDNVHTAIINATQTGTDYVAPAIDLTTELVKLGVPRVTATSIIEGNFEPAEEDSFKEPGYLAAKSILKDIRTLISTRDSMDMRTDLLDALYAYYRVVLCSAKDKEEVRTYLSNAAAKSKPYIADIINKGLSLF